jgi:FlaA1/EpsC-like NDP-sugar epimerase
LHNRPVTKTSYNILPGWMILAIDFLIFFHAAILSHLAFSSFSLEGLSNPGVLLGGVYFAVIATLSTLLLKNNRIKGDEYIVQEILSISRTLIVTSLILGIAALATKIIINSNFVPSLPTIGLSLGLSFFALTFSRLVLRQAADYLTDKEFAQKRVLLIAHNSSKALSRKVLKNNGFSLDSIQAYLSENFSMTSRRILGAPVYEKVEDLDRIIERHQISEIYISEEGLSLEDKQAYIEASLRKGIQPSLLQPLTEWVSTNGEIQLKAAAIEDYLKAPFSLEKKTSLGNDFSHKTVLISGAGSKIGAELCRQLLMLEPAHLILLEQAESTLLSLTANIKKLNTKTTITPVVMNNKNKGRLRAIFEMHNPQIIFHAGMYNDPALMEVYTEEAVKANVLNTKNLVELAQDYDCEKFVLVSSHHAVSPNEIIGASKRLAEIYLQHKNIETSSKHKTALITFRHGEVLGVNDQVLLQIKRDIQKGSAVNIHHPDTEHSFYSVSQTSQFILEACVIGNGGEIYTVQKNNPIKLGDLVQKTVQLSPVKISPELKVHFDKNSKAQEAFPTFNTSYEKAEKATSDLLKLTSSGEIPLNLIGKLEELEAVIDKKDPIALHRFFKDIIPEFISAHQFVALTNRQN